MRSGLANTRRVVINGYFLLTALKAPFIGLSRFDSRTVRDPTQSRKRDEFGGGAWNSIPHVSGGGTGGIAGCELPSPRTTWLIQGTHLRGFT